MPRLTLIGYRGTGKSTVARIVSSRLGCGWTDADEVFERQTGTSIAEHFRDKGEASFRSLESEILRRLLETEAGVLATGGGVVMFESNRCLLRDLGRPVVWLDAPVGVILQRLMADPSTASSRPSLSTAGVFAEVPAVLAAREPLYAATADLRVDASGSPQHVAEQIIRSLPDLEQSGGKA